MNDDDYKRLWKVAMGNIWWDVPRDVAEDIVQEAIVAVWLKSPDNDEAFVTTCAKNAVRSFKRGFRVGRGNEQSLDSLHWLVPSGHCTHEEAIANQTLQNFFEQDWDTEMLYCLYSMSYGWQVWHSYKANNRVGTRAFPGAYQEIADYLGIGYAACKARIERLRIRLRTCHAEEILLT